MEVLFGVDIGGSHVGVSCVLPSGESLGMEERPLVHRDADHVVALVLQLIEAAGASARARTLKDLVVIGIGIGCPGQPRDGMVVAASNFPTWKNVPLVRLVEQHFPGVFVCLLKDSDAAMAGELWGEYKSKYGPISNAVMITLGTGIGMSLFLKGDFYSGSNGLVEGGHMIVDMSPSGRQCGCGQQGCAEAYASASNVVKVFKEATGDSRSIGSADVFHLAASQHNESPDMHATEAEMSIAQASDVLAVLCINICRMVDPQVLIFAGGMSRAGDLLLSRVRERMEVRKWTCLPQDTPMMVASSENAGSVGAAILGDANTMLGAGAGVLALVLWKLQSSQVGHRCPIAGKSMACGLSAIAIYSFVLPWFSAFRH